MNRIRPLSPYAKIRHIFLICWNLFRLRCVVLIYLFCKQLNDCHSYCCSWFLHRICSVFYFCVSFFFSFYFFLVLLFIFSYSEKKMNSKRKNRLEGKLTNVKIGRQIYLSKSKKFIGFLIFTWSPILSTLRLIICLSVKHQHISVICVILFEHWLLFRHFIEIC